jgi:microcystin-dependent protein
MSEPFLGEIRMFANSVVPRGWVPCNGQILAISQNQALFSLLGTTYGGNGIATFQLPNLQGLAALGSGAMPGGSNYTQGQTGGEATHTLTVAETPAHIHTVQAENNNGSTPQSSPQNGLWQTNVDKKLYATTANAVMAPNALGQTGGNQPHPNVQPYLAVNFFIATQGIYPTRP